MPFGQRVLDTLTTQPNGTTKLSDNKTLKLKRKEEEEEEKEEVWER